MDPLDHQSQEPVPLLVEHLGHLPKGPVLDIASGYGRNGLFLASKEGFPVDGFDRNEEAVVFCNEKATRLKLPFTVRRIDLEKEFPSQRNSYSVVTCFYYLDRKIIPKMKAALKIGGVIVYETFLIDQHKAFGKPSRHSFCWEHNELLKSFLDFRILFYHEGIILPVHEKIPGNGRWVAQLIAERIH